jgi:hypothetical protein
MFRRALWIAQRFALLTAVLLTTSAARAQTSASGHVPAPRAAAPSSLGGLPAFGIYPGDHMFQATMKIGSTYQAAERAAPAVAYRRPAPPTVREEATPVEVGITEPAGATELIKIRGPNGEVRSFPIVGGRKAIKTRTIIVRPGESLNLVVYGGQVTIATGK